jgi:hypothetical protein
LTTEGVLSWALALLGPTSSSPNFFFLHLWSRLKHFLHQVP